MRLHKFEKLVDRSGRISPNMDLNFACRQHWSKAGCLSEADLGIFPLI